MKVYVLTFHGDLQYDQPAFLSEEEGHRYCKMVGLVNADVVGLKIKHLKDRTRKDTE